MVYRDDIPIAKLAPDAHSFVDAEAPDGEHIYTLSAIDRDGNEGPLGRCRVIAGDFHLRCAVDGNDVRIAWGPIFVDIAISHFVIRRDGVAIARVGPDVRSYVDPDVAGGVRRYTVHIAVNVSAAPGAEVVLGACTVKVPHRGFVCRVAPPVVDIDWSEVPLPEIVIDFFLIVRDGEKIARTEDLRYLDEPGPGEHSYQVWAISGHEPDDLAISPPVGGFLVGECKVALPGEGVPPPQELTCVDLDVPEGVDIDLDTLLGPHDVLLVWQKTRRVRPRHHRSQR